MTIGEKIRELRKEKDISQKELGILLGVSQQTVGQYETSPHEPKIETLRKIASALEVKLSDLLEAEQIMNPYTTKNKTINHTFPISSSKIDDTNLLEKELTTYFSFLNQKGKSEAIKRIKKLSELPMYNDKIQTLKNSVEASFKNKDNSEKDGKKKRASKNHSESLFQTWNNYIKES